MRYTRNSNSRDRSIGSLVLAFIVAVVLATVWGAIVQTQFNLTALAGIGADIPAGLRLRSTLADIFSGFSPTYAAYVVAPSLLVAFAVAWWVTGRGTGSPAFWFGLSGGVALLAGIPLVNYLAPVALLIGASRDWLCTLLMSLGGVAAGVLFACFPGFRREAWSRPQRDVREREILIAP